MDASTPESANATARLTEAPFDRVLVIANPISGRGLGAHAANEVCDGLRSLGVRADVHLTTGRGDAFQRLRTFPDELDLAVAVGGDGTLREVLEGLVDPETPVGLVPYGTANVLATELGLPRDVHHAVEILARGRTRGLDVATVDGRLSFLGVGVGIDGSIVREVEARRRGPITKWSYVDAALRTLPRYSPPKLRVEVDGEPLDGTFGFVLVGNTVNYAGVIHLAPDSAVDDGVFEVYLFPTGRLPELAGAFARGVLRRPPGGAVELRRARSVRIEADEPAPYQVDGDAGGETPVEIELGPNRYRVVVP